MGFMFDYFKQLLDDLLFEGKCVCVCVCSFLGKLGITLETKQHSLE